ncbi:hypothetical protein MN116_008011 [Schistosoma mekongi]|uniref:Cell wall integrity and stress response component 1 n=1 Tax=Schistosoma mekongi TaxID=38744 RepID=A0AAE1Z741_SCHME|nr:hypothetical protein MN116_008009 [Schistosoma mekongi]KAK4468846.1 hypothetical protein MN116_008011 [Schistosoma mekongi]
MTNRCVESVFSLNHYTNQSIIEMKSQSSVTSLIVIGAGLPRTGTNSLKTALEILYSQPCYHLFEILPKYHCDITKWQNILHEVNMTRRNQLKIRDGLIDILSGYASLTDIPGCGFYEELMGMYPHAKVVLTIRDRIDWLSSLRETILPKSNDSHSLVLDKIKNILGLDGEFMRMAFDSLTFAFQNNHINFDDDAMLLSCYDEYNKRVEETIPSDRLLIHQLGDGWESLCEFLNVEMPHHTPYPHINDRNGTLKCVEQFNEMNIM